MGVALTSSGTAVGNPGQTPPPGLIGRVQPIPARSVHPVRCGGSRPGVLLSPGPSSAGPLQLTRFNWAEM